MLKVLLFGDRGRTLPLSIKITVLTSMVKKRYNEAFLGVNASKNFKPNPVLVVVLVLEFKGL